MIQHCKVIFFVIVCKTRYQYMLCSQYQHRS